MRFYSFALSYSHMDTNNQGASVPPVVNSDQNTYQSQSAAETHPAGDNKVYGIVGYVLPILFFLPLVMDQLKHDAFARFHANQQLLLVVLSVAIMVINTMLVNMFWYMPMMLPLVGLFQFAWLGVFVLQILGVVAVVNHRMTPLPLIGHITLIK